MAEKQSTIDIELEKLTLEDELTGGSELIGSCLPNEYLEILKNLLSNITEVDLIYSEMAAAINHFHLHANRRPIDPLAGEGAVYPSTTLHECVEAFEHMKESTATYFGDELHPFLRSVRETRVELQNKVVELEKTPNLNAVKDALDVSQRLLNVTAEKAFVCESKLSELNTFLYYLTSMERETQCSSLLSKE